MSQLKNHSRRRLAAIVVVVAAVGVASTIYYVQQQLPRRWATVAPGILYRSGQPKTRQLDRAIDVHGIKTVLIVRTGTSESVPDEVEHARQRGLQVVHIPIESRKQISDGQIREFFDVVDNPANQPVLVHCSAGRHRTGYLCALYRIERMNWSLDRAVEEMLSFGFDATDQSVVLDQLKAYRPGTWKRPEGASTAVGFKTASNPS